MNQSWASQSLSRRCNTIVSESFVVPSQIKIELFSVYKEPEQFVLYDEYCKQIRRWLNHFVPRFQDRCICLDIVVHLSINLRRCHDYITLDVKKSIVFWHRDRGVGGQGGGARAPPPIFLKSIRN